MEHSNKKANIRALSKSISHGILSTKCDSRACQRFIVVDFFFMPSYVVGGFSISSKIGHTAMLMWQEGRHIFFRRVERKCSLEINGVNHGVNGFIENIMITYSRSQSKLLKTNTFSHTNTFLR